MKAPSTCNDIGNDITRIDETTLAFAKLQENPWNLVFLLGPIAIVTRRNIDDTSSQSVL